VAYVKIGVWFGRKTGADGLAFESAARGDILDNHIPYKIMPGFFFVFSGHFDSPYL
jgi:hypothetical protein